LDRPQGRGCARSEGAKLSLTLLDHIWANHEIAADESGSSLLYVDLHLIQDDTPQAFDKLRARGHQVRRPDLCLATPDHTVPTDGSVASKTAGRQLQLLEQNCAEFGIPLLRWRSGTEGIAHVVAPEFGLVQPGMVVACADSHTSTHGAFGALPFGIGMSEMAHVLASQTLWQRKPPVMAANVRGVTRAGVTAKDLILHTIRQIGVSGGRGHAIEFKGEGIERMSMEERMTVCNMAIEAGAKIGMVAPDDATFEYLEHRPGAPTGPAWESALDRWRRLRSDAMVAYSRNVDLDLTDVAPQVTWGTTPAMVAAITDSVPDPDVFSDPADKHAAERALQYMGLTPGTPLTEIPIDAAFIGSCANGRIEDLRAAAHVVAGRRVHSRVRALVVPGSATVKRQAEDEGLDRIFTAAGFEWRNAGCSMCLAMNADSLGPGERCASTSNRNFEGRQGARSRTHLASPQMVAAAALAGHFVDVRSCEGGEA
jgi:3-isopropylmalate/(R)-2-methylmalate dehydratase large subunit